MKPWMCTCEKKESNGRELSYPSGDYLECKRCGRPIVASKIKPKMTKDEATNNLFEAAKNYVEAIGGSLVVAGNITISHLPTDEKFNWTLSMRCMGKLPEHPPQPEGEA